MHNELSLIQKASFDNTRGWFWCVSTLCGTVCVTMQNALLLQFTDKYNRRYFKVSIFSEIIEKYLAALRYAFPYVPCNFKVRR